MNHSRKCGIVVRLAAVPLLLVFVLACAQTSRSQSGYRAEIQPYVEFLEQPQTSARDYILGLFADHDVVILCERHHGDISQYDLFVSVISDPRFIDSVGNVFTEIGSITQQEAVNAFIHTEGLTADLVDKSVLAFQRNCSMYPLWENASYAEFIRRLYELNQGLPVEKKINLYNSDVPWDWTTLDSAQLANYWALPGDVRDSIIASQVIRRFDEVRTVSGARWKALVIMNYRHAFRRDFVNPSGITRRNVGRYLFDHYGERTANVFINGVALVSARSDQDVSYAPVQDGKWDAAFNVRHVKDAGFAFQDSPFGRDTFDIWPVKSSRYQDEFTGFAFYLPLDEHKSAIGMPSFIDSVFGEELIRRLALYSTLPGGRWRPLTNLEGMKNDYNVRREPPLYMTDSLNAQIDQWLTK